ncbi:BppU family phage baseplate upper protein [Leuconostoc mesenteroides]|uniref:BppU family phage baseplate upper protein n=1 Tax=Leuconostoc mesenteroides TaxID=1245 RepID=UPI001C1F4515|nr:BppU family phage baseplate upper protein [Leuconostoc mesenteroides]MBU7546695.1 phage baseplate upper protein [Leuconostoc mesenteroides]
MNESKYMIVDLATQQPTIKPIGDYLFARQGDNRRPLPIWFQQSGQPLALDGYTVEWAQTNADGTPLVVSGTTISGAVVGQMIFYFPANAFAVAGAVIGHFLIKKESDGSLISSIDLSFDVKKDNVLMNIDTTPFMNDWEQFKSGIKSQTEALKGEVDGFDSTIKGAQEQANSITTLINNNQVAKKTDLDNYISKSASGAVAGTISADNFKDSAGNDLTGVAKLLSGLIAGYNTAQPMTAWPKRSGIYAYDASTFSKDQLPPYLGTFQTGMFWQAYIDENNRYIKWLGSGWEQYVVGGTWSKKFNLVGIDIYSGSLSKGNTIQLATPLTYFDEIEIRVSYKNGHFFGNMAVGDYRALMAGIVSANNGATLLNLEFSVDSTLQNLTVSQLNQIVGGNLTAVLDTLSINIKGFRKYSVGV